MVRARLFYAVLAVCVGLFRALGSAPAQACEEPPPFYFTPVAQGRAEGPFVFTVDCFEASRACQDDLVSFNVLLDGVSIPGTTSLLQPPRGALRLLAFTPDEPLEVGNVYRAELEGEIAQFEVRTAEDSDPFEVVSLQEGTELHEEGTSYSCQLDDTAVTECGLESPLLHWSTESLAVVVVEGRAGPLDGWLFRSYGSDEDPVRNFQDFQVHTRIKRFPGKANEACFVFEAWNILSAELKKHERCATVTLNSEPEQTVINTPPSLAGCKGLPVQGGASDPAEELLAQWCRERGQHCELRPADDNCMQLERTCAEVEEEQTLRKGKGGCQVTATPGHERIFPALWLALLCLGLSRRQRIPALRAKYKRTLR